MTIRVLVVDDDAGTRQFVADVVTLQRGMELVGAAATTDEAIAVGTSLAPDIALVDVDLPGAGGPEVARALRRSSPQTRVVAYSASATREAVVDMLRAGAVGYVVKPSTVGELLDAIQAATEGRPTVSQGAGTGILEELIEQLRRSEAEAEERQERKRRVESVLDGEGVDFAFQPIVRLDSHTTVGYEALARFPIEPPRTPDVWFKDAHDVGLGVELDMAVARRALQRIVDIPEGRYLSINLSPRTVVAPGFSSLFVEADVTRIVLEMTEHQEVADYDTLLAALAPLRERGVQLAVDDAGAGFASLRHILRLAPDFIKLDVSITRGIDSDRARLALARGLVSFAEEIGIAIVGEGVETAEELDTLRQLGAACAQGYHLGRPGPLAA